MESEHPALRVEEIVQLILSFLNENDSANAAKVCKRFWRNVPQHARTCKLLDKALQWVDANSGHAIMAGSMATWIHEPPAGWFPGDADVFVFNPDKRNDILQICSPDNRPEALKYGGKVYASGPPVVSTVVYPFGRVQIIYVGFLFSNYKQLLDSFDHSAVMLGMPARTEFVFGSRFNADDITMFAPTTRDTPAHFGHVIDRFHERREKYTLRGMPPRHIIRRDIKEDPWINEYRRQGSHCFAVTHYLKQ